MDENTNDISLSHSGENTVIVDIKRHDSSCDEKDVQEVFEKIVEEIDVGDISSGKKEHFQNML